MSHVADKETVARKPHQCRVCGEQVAPGMACHIYTGVEPGEGFYTIHFHIDCWSATRDWTLDDWKTMHQGDMTRAEVRSLALTVKAEGNQ